MVLLIPDIFHLSKTKVLGFNISLLIHTIDRLNERNNKESHVGTQYDFRGIMKRQTFVEHDIVYIKLSRWY
jgi:hypothetical protein